MNPSKFSNLVILPILFIYIVQDVFTRQKFYDKQQHSQEDLQDFDPQSWIDFNKFISTAAFYVIGLFYFYLTVRHKNREEAVATLIYMGFLISMVNVLKLCYHDPRPSVSFDRVKGFKCEPDYGCPSGHALVTTAGLILPPYVVSRDFYRLKNLKHFLIFVLVVLLIFFVILSRVVLGMHSINQIILGVCYGLAFTILFINFGLPKLESYLVKLSLQRESRGRQLGLITIVLAIYLCVCMIIYEIDLEHYQQSDAYIVKVWLQCDFPQSALGKHYYKYLMNKCFISCGYIGISFGFLYGVLFSQRFTSRNRYQLGFSTMTPWRFLLRTLVQMTSGIFILIAVLVFNFVKSNIVYARFFLQTDLPYFLAGVWFCLVVPRLLEKFKLQIEGDFLQSASKPEDQQPV